MWLVASLLVRQTTSRRFPSLANIFEAVCRMFRSTPNPLTNGVRKANGLHRLPSCLPHDDRSISQLFANFRPQLVIVPICHVGLHPKMSCDLVWSRTSEYVITCQTHILILTQCYTYQLTDESTWAAWYHFWVSLQWESWVDIDDKLEQILKLLSNLAVFIPQTSPRHSIK